MNGNFIEDINLKGFLVVQSELFRKEAEPVMNLFEKSISFNRECHIALNNCESVQILVNPENRTILIRPSSSSDKNALIWKRNLKDTYIPKFTCPNLTMQLFRKWGLDFKYHYRATGRLVQSDKKLMLRFDFGAAVTYDGQKIVRECDEF